MDDFTEQTAIPSPADDLSSTPIKRKRRVEYVQPQTRKRRFHDGTPTPKPRIPLREAIKRVQKERFHYAPLRDGEDIRVLILEKPDPGDAETIKCRLVPSSLPPGPGALPTSAIEHHEYEALSYYWGQEDPSIRIEITNISPTAPVALSGVAQQKFWIRQNLYAALVQLREHDHDVVLWVDTICINQDDPEEKTEQASKMHEIYNKAENVCIWLGVGQASTNRLTFDFIKEMLDLRRLDQLVASEDHAETWLWFAQLMRNRWFSRRWVVQELALAKEATVHYGNESIQWTDFRDAVALFVTKHDNIKQLLSKSRITPEPDPIGDMRALGANTLVEATSNLFRRADNGQILERLLSLETLVSTLLAFEAKDPRDIVYTVLSIAKDTPYSDSTTMDPRITPDYTKTLAELCTDFVAYCVEYSKSLDIICRHWAPVPKEEWAGHLEDMPTWVSLISGSAFGEPEAALQGRSNGDSLVGTPNRQHQKNYNASASLPPSARFLRIPPISAANNPPLKDDIDGSTINIGPHGAEPTLPSSRSIDKTKVCILSAKGMILDTIGELSPRSPQGMILKESLEMAGWTSDIELDKVPESLWRTLVADRGPHGINAPSWYYRSCLEYLTHITQNGDLNTDTLIKDPSTPSTLVTFLKRVQQMVWNRKFFRSSRDALFGLVPTEAQESDYICILFGCSVPVILRKDETKDQRLGEDDLFTFVGEAYVDGMMDGEAVPKPKALPQPPFDDYTIFHIR